MNLRVLLLSAIILTGCSKKVDQIDKDSSDSVDTVETELLDTLGSENPDVLKLENYLATGDIGNINIENIEFDCAIVVYPTKEQIEQMKLQEGEDDFAIIADDSQWYLAQALENIDSSGVEVINASEKYLRLKGLNQTWELDVRKKNMPAWNIILVNRNKAPMIVSTAELTTDEVKEYFDIK